MTVTKVDKLIEYIKKGEYNADNSIKLRQFHQLVNKELKKILKISDAKEKLNKLQSFMSELSNQDPAGMSQKDIVKFIQKIFEHEEE